MLIEIAVASRRWEWGPALIYQRGLSERDVSDGRVLAITLLVVSLGVANSINPVTIAIAIYLASTRDPQRRLAATPGVFAVYVSARSPNSEWVTRIATSGRTYSTLNEHGQERNLPRKHEIGAHDRADRAEVEERGQKIERGHRGPQRRAPTRAIAGASSADS